MSQAVLLLHGQPGSAADWNAVAARLAGQADVLAIDRPGWDGHSRARNLAGNAEAALAALDRRGIERAVVVGHSLGAAIAAWVAARHPERVSALILASPAANRASLDAVDRWMAAPLLGELAAVAAMGGLGLALSAGRVRRRLTATTQLAPSYLEGARRTLLTPAAWRAYTVEQRALVNGMDNLEATLPAIAAPTAILVGDHDRIVRPAAARALARQIPGARLVVCPGAGHLLPQRDPGFVAGEILAALNSARRSTLAGE
jgi:pimeloyl-ACP methyl ester carboxylesterase